MELNYSNPTTTKNNAIHQKNIKGKKREFFCSVVVIAVACIHWLHHYMLQYKYKWMNGIKINGFYWCSLSRVCVCVNYVNASVIAPFRSPFAVCVDCYTHLYHSSIRFFFHFASYFLVYSQTLSSEWGVQFFFVHACVWKSVHIIHNACLGLSAFHLYPFNIMNIDYNAHMTQYVLPFIVS